MAIVKLTPENEAELKAAGVDPSQFALDDETGEAVNLGSFSGIKEGLKGFARGATAGAVSTPEFIGEGADLLHATFPGGPVIGSGRSVFTDLSKGAKDKVGEMLPRDPRAGIGTSTMEGLGNLLGLVGTGGLIAKGGNKLLSLAAKAAMKEGVKKEIPDVTKKLLSRVVAGQAAEQGATQIANRELNRAVKAGEEPSPGKALLKAGASLPANLLTQQLFGAGRLAGKLVDPMTGAGGFGARRLADAATGATGGALGNIIEQGLVEGKVDPSELGQATATGAAVSTVVGTPMDMFGGNSAKKSAPKKANRFLSEGIAAKKPTIIEPTAELTPLDTQSILLAQQKGIERTIPKSARTPFDDAVDSLVKEGVQLNEANLKEIHAVSNDKTKLPGVIRKLALEHTLREADRPMDPAKLIDLQKEKLDRVGELTSKRDSFVKTMEKNKEILGKLDATGEQKYNAKWALAEAEKHVGALDEMILRAQEASAPGLEGRGFVRNPRAAAEESLSNPEERTEIREEGVTPGMEVAINPNSAQIKQQQEALKTTLQNPAVQETLRGQAEMEAGRPIGNQDVGFESLPLSENTKNVLRQYMEGENGGPFGEGNNDILPHPDKFYRGFQTPDELSGFRHMSKGSIWHDPFVLEVKNQKATNTGANETFKGVIKPENVERIFVDVNAYKPYPTDYVNQLKQKYPNAEVVNVKLNADESGFVKVGNEPPRVYHSGFDISPITKWIKERLKDSGLANRPDPATLLRVFLGSEGSRLAARHPAGAYITGKFNELTNKRSTYINEAQQALETFKPALEDPEFSSWVNDSITNQKWDLTDPRAQKFAEESVNLEPFWKRFHEIQDEKRIGVSRFDAAGNRTVTSTLDSPGHFAMMIGDHVYKAMEKGGSEWAKFEEDWIENWKTYRGNKPNANQEAEAALMDIIKPLGRTIGTGQPTFSAVRVQQGVPLPPSWRSKNVYESASRYIPRWATDMAWGEIIQYDPVARRALGITEDPMGNLTHETDPKTFGEVDVPSRELAVREGERVGANWVKEDADPNNIPIDMVVGDRTVRSLINSYTQSAHQDSGKFVRTVGNPFNSLSGSLIMQTPAAARDLASAVTMLNEYIPYNEIHKAMPAFIEAVTNPNNAIVKAKAGGAVPQDPQQGLFQHEAAGVVGNAMYKTADGLRTFTGKNYADQWAKSIVYNVIHDLVESAGNHGIEHSLVTEFGPKDPNLSVAQIAQQTAAAVVDRVQPRYDFNSLPAAMIPQNRTILGTLFKLSSFPIARFNKWYEDAVIPAYAGKPERLIKSLVVSGLIGGTVTQELINFLTNKKPQDLTWAEWLGLPDKQKAKTALPTLFGYIQAQGSLGSAGDVGYQLSKALSGQGVQPPPLSGQYPAAIVGIDWMSKSASFAEAVKDGYVDLYDLADLGGEFLRTAQNVRLVENWMGTDKAKTMEGNREERMFKTLYERSPKTGERVASDAGIRPTFFPDPFSFSKRLGQADTQAEMDKLIPEIKRRTAAGMSIPIQNALQSEIYYQEVARRRGKETARRLLEEDLRKQEAVEGRRAVISQFK